MKRVLFFAILLNGFVFTKAQLPVFNLNQDTLFWLGNTTISTNNDAKILYSTQGNILFSGNSTNYKNILFSLALDSLNQKEGAIIYGNKGGKTAYSIQKNTLLYQYNNTENPIIQYVKSEDTWAAYNLLNDSLLFYIPNIYLTPAQLFGISYAYIKSTTFLQDFKANYNTKVENNAAAVIPINHNGITWIWDGKLLYPYGASIHNNMVWIFDGQKLAPRNFARTQEEWSWDGSTLKPLWGGNPTYFWSWQQGVLRQIWNNNYKNEYMIDNGILRKRFTNFGEPEWQIQGNVPLAIITAVALGILYR